MTRTREQADEARHDQQRLTTRQMRERTDLRRQLLGNRTSGGVQSQAARWRQQAATARRDLAAIETLPLVEAAQLVHARDQQEQAQQEATKLALAERKARAAKLHDYTHRPRGHGPTPPDPGLGR